MGTKPTVASTRRKVQILSYISSEDVIFLNIFIGNVAAVKCFFAGRIRLYMYSMDKTIEREGGGKPLSGTDGGGK